MALIGGTSSGSTRPKRPRPLSPGERMAADFAAESGGGRASDADVNDNFAARLARDAEATERARRHAESQQMSPAARRAMSRADEPVQKKKFTHETDIGNVEPIRRGGVRPSRGGSAMGHEGVYAYEGGYDPSRRIPEGRAVIEFEADPNRITGRGTMGSRAVALGGGAIDPADITGGYNSSGRMFNLLGGTPYHGLYSLLAGMFDLPDFRTPADWVMENLMQESDISPYRQQEVTLA